MGFILWGTWVNIIPVSLLDVLLAQMITLTCWLSEMKSQWILRFILSATWMSVTNGTAWGLEPWWRCSGENILASFNHSASTIKAFWSFLVWPIFLYIWLSWIASHNVYLHCITWSDQSFIFIFQLLSSCWCFVECWWIFIFPSVCSMSNAKLGIKSKCTCSDSLFIVAEPAPV